MRLHRELKSVRSAPKVTINKTQPKAHVINVCQDCTRTTHYLKDVLSVKKECSRAMRMLPSVRSVRQVFTKMKKARQAAWLAALGSLSPTQIQPNVMYVFQEDTWRMTVQMQ